ncbi:MAG: sensor histidine kinase [Coriobacteriales bacterium]|jgi:two-component system sensor histidine kinase BaeS
MAGKDTEEKTAPAFGAGMSFKARITLLFGLVSIMTALVATLVLSIVWETHFDNYAEQNMQRVASLTASSLEQHYELNGGWDERTLEIPRVIADETIGIQATDLHGDVIYGDVFESYDSDPEKDGDGLPAQNTVSAPIIVNGSRVGTVSAWTFGSDGPITLQDKMFREQAYMAMIIAMLAAIALSCVIGYFVARGLADPIRRITKTAGAIRSGNLEARTNLVGMDEIAQLGMTFDDMAQSIENDRELERRLINDVAHELRTPLMAMQATMEAMVDGVLPADEQRLIMLNNEVIRLGKLVDALLKLSRLENRSTPTNKVELDLGKLVEELVLNHQMLVEEAGLALEYRYEPGIMVEADRDLIQQATANLLSNAVRYTPQGGKVSMEVRHDEVMAQISISDTGIGLSDEDLKHIFSRFWRADGGRARESGGLGVGLAIVKEIVDRHDGWVNVESKLGEGSTFTINIPLVKEDPRKQSKRKQDRQGNTSTVARFLKFPAKKPEVDAADAAHDRAGQDKARQKKEKPRREKRERRERRDKPKITTPVNAATWWRVQKRDSSGTAIGKVTRMGKRDKRDKGDEDARDSD